MNKVIKVDITKGELKDLIKNLKKFGKDADKVRKSIEEELKKEAKSKIQDSLSGSAYQAENPTSYFETEDKIGITGTQAVYDEYGTGTLGANSPHPEKAEGLKGYNTGPTIRTNAGFNESGAITTASKKGIPLNGMYWTYYNNGEKIYTQGRPAGMHVYKGQKAIRSKFKKVSEKKVGEWLSKL